MKCPYCGCESKEQHCPRCKAMIPVETAKEETNEEPVKVRRKKDKE